MNNSTKTRAYSIIAAILFAFQALYPLTSNIKHLSVLDLIFVVIMSAFAIVLFIGKKNISLIVVSSTMVLLSIFYLISYFSWYSVLYFLAYASLTAVIIWGIKNNEIVKKIFFIPAAILLINTVINIIGWYSTGLIYFLKDYFTYLFLMTLSYVVNVASLFFLGLWVSKPVMSNSTVNTTSQVKSSLIVSADKLKACKELLDAGVITQEEFEEKKQQILNL